MENRPTDDRQERYPETAGWSVERRERYFRENEGLVHSLVNRISHTFAPYIDREDLFQEASVAFFRAFDTYDPARGVKFSSYVSTVMANAVHSLLHSLTAAKRTPGQPPLNEEELEAVRALIDPLPSVEELVLTREMLQSVETFLSENYSERDCKIFYHLTGKTRTQTELAQELGCTQSNISSIYSGMRRRVREKLKEEGFEIARYDP